MCSICGNGNNCKYCKCLQYLCEWCICKPCKACNVSTLHCSHWICNGCNIEVCNNCISKIFISLFAYRCFKFCKKCIGYVGTCLTNSDHIDINVFKNKITCKILFEGDVYYDGKIKYIKFVL